MALGRIHMSYDDFCRCTPSEFEAVCKANRSVEREQWERLRTLATITVQPYAKDKLDPKKLLSFPWDSETEGETQTTQAPKLTKEQRYERFKYLTEKLDGIKQHNSYNLQA